MQLYGHATNVFVTAQRNQEIRKMSRKAMIVMLCLLSALNAIALAINISAPSKAAVGGMSYQKLTQDPDFTRAVRSIVQECRVYVDVEKLRC